MADRTVVVTGAAQGIGRAIAVRLATPATAIAVLDRDAEALAITAAAIDERGATAMPLSIDLTDRAAVEAGFAAIVAAHGEVDVLVNNVGQGARDQASPFSESDPDLSDFLLDISLRTTIACSRQVAAAMKTRRRGRIVNIASEAAFTGSTTGAAYAAAKAGVIGFTRSLAMELAPFGATVNAVAPGPIRTRALDLLPPAAIRPIIAKIPVGFVGEPEDVAHAVAFFAAEESRFITGQTLLVNGGRWMT